MIRIIQKVLIILLLGVYYERTIAQDVTNTGVVETPVSKVIKIQADLEIAEGESLELPHKYDLTESRRFPPTMNQKDTRACTSFTLCYALKTFQEAEDSQYEIYDAQDNAIDSLIFSPSYLFKVMKNGKNCRLGVEIPTALIFLEMYGSVTIKDLPFDYNEVNTTCAKPHEELIAKGKNFRIANFYRLSNARIANPEEISGQRLDIIERIKKRLVNHYPIIFGSHMNNQFKTESYTNYSVDGIPYWDNSNQRLQDYHAMLIVGYDDEKESFKVFNSWGKYGLIWMKYKVFRKLTTHDIYVATDVPRRYHDNYLNIFANKSQHFEWKDYQVAVNENKLSLATGINEHSFIENDNYKISNLSTDYQNHQAILEIMDKSLKSQPIKVILNTQEEQSFSIGQKEYKVSLERISNGNIADIKIDIIDEQLLSEEKFPIQVDYNSGRIDNKSYRFEDVNAKLTSNGIFIVTATQSNNRIAGWHGKLVFDFLDKKENPIYKLETPVYAQNGTWENAGEKMERSIRYEALIENLDVLKEVNDIKISAYRE